MKILTVITEEHVFEEQQKIIPLSSARLTAEWKLWKLRTVSADSLFISQGQILISSRGEGGIEAAAIYVLWKKKMAEKGMRNENELFDWSAVNMSMMRLTGTGHRARISWKGIPNNFFKLWPRWYETSIFIKWALYLTECANSEGTFKFLVPITIQHISKRNAVIKKSGSKILKKKS